jgi:carotenoid cleavage dioxygenase-like enzyme
MSFCNRSAINSAVGFSSSLQEASRTELEIVGKIPNWLSGTLVRTGPALFENANEKFAHWFDGLAKLYSFSIESGAVQFTSKFLQSDAYKLFSSSGKVRKREFATNPNESAFERIAAMCTPNLTDNANVNVAKFSTDCYVALTETPVPVQFDLFSLETIGHFRYNDSVKCQVTTAHPHLDANGDIYNIFTKIGPKSAYQFCRISEAGSARAILAEVKVQNPAYVHSFALTDNYIILAEGSYAVAPLSLLLSGKPFIENFVWQPSRPSRFIVVRKDGAAGSKVHVIETEPFFVFHNVNAYESNGDIIVDLLAYDNAGIVKALYLENLRSPNRIVPSPAFRRYTLDLTRKLARNEDFGASFELPRINYFSHNRKPYRYVYGVVSSSERDLFSSIAKIDLTSGETEEWKELGYCVTEPVFVASKDCGAEDDGVLLSIVLNCTLSESFLLMLDASTMNELARARIPHLIPFHFHGQFFGI